jgi:hydrogenase maturation protein HypF
LVESLVERGLNAPPTSSMGRLFDAVAALLGLCPRASFDGEAPMRLEALAQPTPFDAGYPVVVENDCIQMAPLWLELTRDLERGVSPPHIARRFHSWVVDLIVTVSRDLGRRHHLERVAFSGGVFVNRIVAEEAAERLSQDGLVVLEHRLVPPNDGGLSLGQLAIAAAQDGAIAT